MTQNWYLVNIRSPLIYLPETLVDLSSCFYWSCWLWAPQSSRGLPFLRCVCPALDHSSNCFSASSSPSKLTQEQSNPYDYPCLEAVSIGSKACPCWYLADSFLTRQSMYLIAVISWHSQRVIPLLWSIQCSLFRELDFSFSVSLFPYRLWPALNHSDAALRC